MSPSASKRSADSTLRALCATIIVALLFVAPDLHAQGAEGITGVADAEPAPQMEPSVVGVPIDLFVDGRAAGTISASIIAGAVSVDRARLVEVLGPLLEEATLVKLRAGEPGAEQSEIALEALARLGIEAEFDASLIRVSIRAPAEIRRPRELRLGVQAAPPIRPPEGPADFSASLTMRAKAELRLGAVVTAPLALELQPAFNVWGWVLEADANAGWDAGWTAEVQTARIVRDFPGISSRLTFGSLFLPVTGFLSSPARAGIEFTRRPADFHPEGPSASIGEELFVVDPSLVDVLLNGRPLASLQLEPGRYLFPDIPFASGINDLTIEAVQRIVPFDSRLLPSGETAFSASVGVPQWTLSDPVLSGFLLRGLSPFVTAGIEAQAGLDRQLAGAEVLLATRAGNLRGLAGLSRAAAGGVDYSGLLEYRLAFPSAARLPALGLSARYTGRTFLGPLDERDENSYSWQVSGSLSQALPLDLGMNVSLAWQAGWGAVPDATTVSLTLSRAVASGTSLALLINAQLTQAAPAEIRGILTLTTSAPGGRRSAGMTAALDGNTASVDLHMQPFSGPNAPTLAATMNGLPTEAGGASGSVSALYAGPRFEAALSDSFSSGQNTLAFEAGAALVTAGGAVGLSRPVSDSFAMVIPRDNMRSERVVVNAGAGEREAVAEAGRPAVLPWLQAYAPTAITVEAPAAPPGADAGEYIRTLLPTYRSGVAVRVGSRATVYGEGYLLTAEGKAVAFRPGEARPTDDPRAKPIQFFTDENGMFQVYGLAPGDWNLLFEGEEQFAASLLIPEDAEGLYTIGSLRLPLHGTKG